MTITNPETLVGILRRRAAELPEHVAYRFLGDGETESHQLSYAALDQQARAIAARLQALGSPGQPVLMLYGDGLEPLAAFFGCLYAGMIAVPLIPPRPSQRPGALAAEAADAGAVSVLTTQARLARAQPLIEKEPALRRLHWLPTDAPGDGATAADWRAPEPQAGDVAALLYTSGSTSQPKGVMLTQRGLLGSPFSLPPGIDPSWTLNAVSWMPLYHIAGLTNALLILQVGRAAEIRLPAEAVLEQPLRWLRAITRYRALSAGGPELHASAVRGPGGARRARRARPTAVALCKLHRRAHPGRGDTART